MLLGLCCAMNDEKEVVKSFLESAPVLGWAWLMLMAIWGGTVRYLRDIKRKSRRFIWRDALLEWIISAFSGIVTAYVCMWMDMPFAFTAAAAGISGHLGGAAIDVWESRFRSIAKK